MIAIGRASGGYNHELTDRPVLIVLPIVVLIMGAITAWGLKESVAAAMTVIEIGGLIPIVIAAAQSPDVAARILEIWTGIASRSAASDSNLWRFLPFSPLSDSRALPTLRKG